MVFYFIIEFVCIVISSRKMSRIELTLGMRNVFIIGVINYLLIFF